MNLNELRSEVKHLEMLSKRKARRMGVKGIDATKVNEWALREGAKIHRYTRKQLESYAKQLREFNSRQTAYVRLGGGDVVSAAKWREYKAAERRVRRQRKRLYDQISNHTTPYGLTVAERAKLTRPAQRGKGDTNHHLLSLPNRSPEAIRTIKALEELTAHAEKVSGRQYRAKLRQGRRQNIQKMLTYVGLDDLQEDVEQLTDKQFDYLWTASQGFNHDVSVLYHLVKRFSEEGDPSKALDHVLDENRGVLSDWVNSARALK